MVWQSCAWWKNTSKFKKREEAQVDGSLWDALQRMTNKRRRPELWLCRSRLSRFAKPCRRSNGRDCLGVPNPLGAWISGSPSKLARGVSYPLLSNPGYDKGGQRSYAPLHEEAHVEDFSGSNSPEP